MDAGVRRSFVLERRRETGERRNVDDMIMIMNDQMMRRNLCRIVGIKVELIQD